MRRRLMISNLGKIPNLFDFMCYDGKIRTPDEAKGKAIAICVKVGENEATFMYINDIKDVCWSPNQSGTICPYLDDGFRNTEIVLSRSDYSSSNFPAFYACDNLNNKYPQLKWYMPSINEISNLFISNKSSIRNAFSLAAISSNIIFDQQVNTNNIRYLASTDGYRGNERQCSAYSMAVFSDLGRWKYAINDSYMGDTSYSRVIPFSKLEY